MMFDSHSDYPNIYNRSNQVTVLQQTISYFLTIISSILIIITLPFSLIFCFKVVQDYERSVTLRLGNLIGDGARGSGIVFIIPCIDTYCKVDLRTVSFNVPPQEVLTSDFVCIKVDAVVYYRIVDSTASILNVSDVGRSTRRLAAITLRNVVATKTLTEIISERVIISNKIENNLQEATRPWGVDVERVEMKEVRLPDQLQRLMATEAETEKAASAQIILSIGEKKSSRLIRSAATAFDSSSTAIQLKYLLTLSSISSAHKDLDIIVFPFPIELAEPSIKFISNATKGFGLLLQKNKKSNRGESERTTNTDNTQLLETV